MQVLQPCIFYFTPFLFDSFIKPWSEECVHPMGCVTNLKQREIDSNNHGIA